MEGYTKIKEIGKGKYGTTYTVKDNKTGITILMKQIPKSEVSRKSVLREVQILQSVREVCQDFLVCYIDFQEDKNNYYIFTEYYGNYITVSEFLENYRPSVTELTTILTNLLMGLQTIHDNGIIHRDIKPDNILIDPESFDVKYIDFNLSCLEDDLDCLNKLKGTPYYIAPELWQLEIENYGKGKQYKQKLPIEAYQASDIWSLGLVFFYLIRNYHPFFKYDRKDNLSNYLLDLKNTPGSEVYDINYITTTFLREVVAGMLRPQWEERANIEYLINLLRD